MTLELDQRSFSILQDWRTRYFPPERNYIPTHLTLLHTLSIEQVSRLRAAWHLFEHLPTVRMRYVAPRLLGNGVAIDVTSKDLVALRASIITVIAGSLTRQDQQPFRAHVTIQNKVSAAAAKELHKSLSSSFEPWCGEANAILIWKYLGGPWAHEAQFYLNKAPRTCIEANHGEDR